jgi:hypothetical protein
VGNPVMLVQQADAAVVRHNNAVEAPLFAQDGGQQEAVAVPGWLSIS